MHIPIPSSLLTQGCDQVDRRLLREIPHCARPVGSWWGQRQNKCKSMLLYTWDILNSSHIANISLESSQHVSISVLIVHFQGPYPCRRSWKYDNKVREFFVETSTKQTIRQSELLKQSEIQDRGESRQQQGFTFLGHGWLKINTIKRNL